MAVSSAIKTERPSAASSEPRRRTAWRNEAGADALPLWGGDMAGTCVKLAGPLAARSLRLRLALALEIERHCSADEILQGRLIHLVAVVDVDGAPDIPVEAGVEQPGRVRQRSSFGKCHLDDVLMRLSGADDAAVGKDGSPRRCRLDPLPLFDDLRISRV